jgi:hypothetical protein
LALAGQSGGVALDEPGFPIRRLDDLLSGLSHSLRRSLNPGQGWKSNLLGIWPAFADDGIRRLASNTGPGGGPI